LGAKLRCIKPGQAELFTSEPSAIFTVFPKQAIPLKEERIHKTNTDLREEYKALGFLRNAHLFALWKDEILAVKYRVKAILIIDYVNKNVKIVDWPVTQKDVWTKDGLTMSFLSLEDETGLYETVIFPQMYDR
jgi:DNA polymerase-3 subunit alpha/error-prone DNA polymerase